MHFILFHRITKSISPLKVEFLFDLPYYHGYDERAYGPKALLLLLLTKETINFVAFYKCC